MRTPAERADHPRTNKAARRIPRTAEEREAAIQRLITKPPHRILEETVKRRKRRAARTYPSAWLRDVWRQQKGRCFYCNCRMGEMTIDHRIPLSRGGKNERSNIVGACEPCNQAKADLLPGEITARAGAGAEAIDA